jgi:hypothetical protein
MSPRGNRPMTAINPAMDDGAIARMPPPIRPTE